jgi:site-specific recombinase XerD
MVGPMKPSYDNSKLIEEYFTGMTITGGLANSSIYKYRDSINKFLSVLGGKFIGDLELRDFDHFILRMRENGASGSRIRNVITAVKVLIRYLQEDKLIRSKLDVEKIRKPKIERKEVSYLSDEEIVLILKSVREDIAEGMMIRKVRMMALLLLMLQTAARLGEALSIKIKDVDRINMEIPIIGKGRKPRSLFLSGDTLFWIDKYLSLRSDANQYLFVTLNGQSKWQQTDVGRSFRRYREKSGITKPFVLHTLRHTAATQLALKGVPMNEIQKILGHSRLETTIKYYIGAVEKDLAKKVMQDEHYRYIPKEMVGDV